jgi:hypothetical protein
MELSATDIGKIEENVGGEGSERLLSKVRPPLFQVSANFTIPGPVGLRLIFSAATPCPLNPTRCEAKFWGKPQKICPSPFHSPLLIKRVYLLFFHPNLPILPPPNICKIFTSSQPRFLVLCDYGRRRFLSTSLTRRLQSTGQLGKPALDLLGKSTIPFATVFRILPPASINK